MKVIIILLYMLGKEWVIWLEKYNWFDQSALPESKFFKFYFQDSGSG